MNHEHTGWVLYIDGVLALCMQASVWHEQLSAMTVVTETKDSASCARLQLLVELVSLVFKCWQSNGEWRPTEEAVAAFWKVGATVHGGHDAGQAHYEAMRTFLEEVRSEANLVALFLKSAAAGMLRVANRLQAVSAEVSRLHWNEELESRAAAEYFFAVGYATLLWVLLRRARVAGESMQMQPIGSASLRRCEQRIQSAWQLCEVKVPELSKIVQRLFDWEHSPSQEREPQPLPSSCGSEKPLHVESSPM